MDGSGSLTINHMFKRSMFVSFSVGGKSEVLWNHS